MRAFHQELDRLNGWLVARRPQAPVSSTIEELGELAALAPGALHVLPEPTDLTIEDASHGLGGRDHHIFASAAPSGERANDRVHVVRWLSGAAPTDAAVIMLHGGFARSFAAERLLAPSFLEAGIDVFAIALPWHMERSPAEADYSGQYLISGDVPRLVRGFVQGAHDAAAFATALRSRGYARLFAGGISLGGNVAAQLAVLTEFEFVYLLTPAADPFVTLWRTPIGAGVVRAARAAGFADDIVAEAMRLISPKELGPPRTPGQRIRIVMGEHDLLCPPIAIEELADAWATTDVERLDCGHRTFAFHLFGVRRRLAETARHLPALRKAQHDPSSSNL